MRRKSGPDGAKKKPVSRFTRYESIREYDCTVNDDDDDTTMTLAQGYIFTSCHNPEITFIKIILNTRFLSQQECFLSLILTHIVLSYDYKTSQ